MPKRNRLLLPLALAAAFLPLQSQAVTRCVNPGGTDGCFARITDAIAASAGVGDTVEVAAGTYSESNIFVDRSVTIRGAGRDATVVDASVGGANGPQVFRFLPSLARNVTVSDMTVRGGRRGFDLGGGNDVTLERMRVTGNGPETGAGIFNGASVFTLRDSLVDGNFATDPASIGGCDWGGASGGGIASLCGGGANFIYNSSIVGNTAGRWGGGMIVNDGILVIENSTFSGNAAQHADPFLGGGALFSGGGFPNVTIRYSTIADNSAVGDGGGLWGDGIRIHATVLQHNAGGDCASRIAFSVPVQSLGYNVSGDGTCPSNQAGDAVADAQLGVLALNGGTTPTHALAYTSPAVDRIPSTLCTLASDQDGVARPQHGACDAGASEHVFTAEELVTILAGDVVGVGPGGSLAAKVATALAYLQQGQSGAACSTLRALGNEVRAQSGKKITVAQANDLLAAIAEIAATAGC